MNDDDDDDDEYHQSAKLVHYVEEQKESKEKQDNVYDKEIYPPFVSGSTRYIQWDFPGVSHDITQREVTSQRSALISLWKKNVLSNKKRR